MGAVCRFQQTAVVLKQLILAAKSNETAWLFLRKSGCEG